MHPRILDNPRVSEEVYSKAKFFPVILCQHHRPQILWNQVIIFHAQFFAL
jgi:hypothetical protein